MEQYRKEVIAGIFVSAGIIILLFSSIFFSNTSFLLGRYYTVNALFSNISGLSHGAAIRIAGVPIGRVHAIMLTPEGTMAQVQCAIRNGIQLPEDTIAVIKNSGLLGEKYIQLVPGSSKRILVDGDELFETQSPLDFEELLGKFVFGANT